MNTQACTDQSTGHAVRLTQRLSIERASPSTVAEGLVRDRPEINCPSPTRRATFFIDGDRTP